MSKSKRVIQVPAPHTIVGPSGPTDKEFTFSELLLGFLLNDAKWGQSLDGIETCLRIREKVRAMNGELVLERTEWEPLVAITKNPSQSYNPVLVTQVVHFLHAITEAKVQS